MWRLREHRIAVPTVMGSGRPSFTIAGEQETGGPRCDVGRARARRRAQTLIGLEPRAPLGKPEAALIGAGTAYRAESAADRRYGTSPPQGQTDDIEATSSRACCGRSGAGSCARRAIQSLRELARPARPLMATARTTCVSSSRAEVVLPEHRTSWAICLTGRARAILAQSPRRPHLGRHPRAIRRARGGGRPRSRWTTPRASADQRWRSLYSGKAAPRALTSCAPLGEPARAFSPARLTRSTAPRRRCCPARQAPGPSTPSAAAIPASALRRPPLCSANRRLTRSPMRGRHRSRVGFNPVINESGDRAAPLAVALRLRIARISLPRRRPMPCAVVRVAHHLSPQEGQGKRPSKAGAGSL